MKFFWYMHTRCYDDEVLPSKKREKEKKKAQECRKLLATKPKTRSDPIESTRTPALTGGGRKEKQKKVPPQKRLVVSIRPSQRKTKKVSCTTSLSPILFLIQTRSTNHFTAGTTFSLSLTSPPKRPTVTRSIFLAWSLTIMPSQ